MKIFSDEFKTFLKKVKFIHLLLLIAITVGCIDIYYRIPRPVQTKSEVKPFLIQYNTSLYDLAHLIRSYLEGGWSLKRIEFQKDRLLLHFEI